MLRNITTWALAALILAASATISSPAHLRAAPGTHFSYLPSIKRAGASGDFATTHSGAATFYAATGGGSCSFAPSPDDLMVAAMNREQYNNAAWCGAYVEVTGPRGVIVVRIVDLCPDAGCVRGTLDLSRQAFARIDDPVHGRAKISWRLVRPALSGKIAYRFKEGSSQWWTAVQIRNHRNPIAKFEYLTASGQFKEVPRTSYNYFAEHGMGPGPYTFRVTDIYGNTLVDSGVRLVEGGVITGGGQFP